MPTRTTPGPLQEARLYNRRVQRRILWYTLGGTAADAEFTASAILLLLDRLGRALPGLKLSGAEVTGELLEGLIPALQSGHLDGAVRAVKDWRGRERPGVVTHLTVYCPDARSQAARAARRRLRHAEWGISLAGALSLTYARGNPYALWHESLHLLGAQDHYDLRTFRTTCGMPTCVMQYAPDENTVGSSPFLCPRTAAVLRQGCG